MTGPPAAPAPVRPPAEMLELVVRALALPGVASGRVRSELRAGGVGGGSAGAGAVAALRSLARRVWPTLTAAERERARGWARAALATIYRTDTHVLTEDMDAYPERLRQLALPPYAVFARGRLELIESPMVGVVGTRRCTPYGEEVAGRMGRGLAAAGVTVISGLARGIDRAAHRGAGAARTVAVLGCGIDVHYPRQNRALQDEIARDGLLLSELLPGAPPEGHNFPRRNRIIAALSLGVVVVEAPVKSGALLTANHATELDRTVFAVPGPVVGATSAGTNALIRDGVPLVTDAREVLTALNLPLPPDGAELEPAPDGLHGVGLALWRALGPAARHADALADDLSLPPHQSLASLLALEVQGHVRQLPGMRFVRA